MGTYLAQFPFGTLAGLAVVVTGAFAALYFMRHRTSPSLSWLLLRAATIYYLLLFLALFWYPATLRGTQDDASLLPLVIQLIPLSTLLHADPVSTWGTFALLVPLPVLVYLHCRSMKRTCAAALVIALLIEPVQLLINTLTGFPNFVVDVDDVLLQLLGCVAGMLVIAAAKRLASVPRVAEAA